MERKRSSVFRRIFILAFPISSHRYFVFFPWTKRLKLELTGVRFGLASSSFLTASSAFSSSLEIALSCLSVNRSCITFTRSNPLGSSSKRGAGAGWIKKKYIKIHQNIIKNKIAVWHIKIIGEKVWIFKRLVTSV